MMTEDWPPEQSWERDWMTPQERALHFVIIAAAFGVVLWILFQ